MEDVVGEEQIQTSRLKCLEIRFSTKFFAMKAAKVISHYVRRFHYSEASVGTNIEDIKLERAASAILPYEDVPGPKPIPFLGNTWRFLPFIGDYQIEYVDKVSKRLHEEYGSVVKISGLLGKPDLLFLFDPVDIEKVFRAEDTMPLRPSMPSLNYYKHVYKKDFFDEENAGVIAVHGENWQKFRSKVSQIMLQPRIAKMYVKPIEETAAEFVAKIHKLKDSSNEMPDDFLNEIHKWSLEAIARIALDVRLGCLDDHANPDTQRLIDALTTFFMNVPILELKFPMWRIFNTPTFKKYIGALDTITEITLTHVNRALKSLQEPKSKEGASILQRLLFLENDTKTATVLALDMFLVGIDTTSNAVASILYQLALNQEKQENLFREISKTFPDSKENFTIEKLESMTYLKACIKETMRLYPVVIGNGRCTTRDCVIGGYYVPKGVQVVFQHCVISNMEKYFHKSRQFLPERWLKSSTEYEENQKKFHPFASLPFGFGKRMCLGRRFSELEIQVLIAKIVQCYKVEYHHKKLDYYVHPMYTPNGPLKLRFVNR